MKWRAIVIFVPYCSGGDRRHAGRDLLQGEGGDRGRERAHRVGAAPRAAVAAPRASSPLPIQD